MKCIIVAFLSKCIKLDMSVDQAIKYIISAGLFMFISSHIMFECACHQRQTADTRLSLNGDLTRIVRILKENFPKLDFGEVFVAVAGIKHPLNFEG